MDQNVLLQVSLGNMARAPGESTSWLSAQERGAVRKVLFRKHTKSLLTGFPLPLETLPAPALPPWCCCPMCVPLAWVKLGLLQCLPALHCPGVACTLTATGRLQAGEQRLTRGHNGRLGGHALQLKCSQCPRTHFSIRGSGGKHRQPKNRSVTKMAPTCWALQARCTFSSAQERHKLQSWASGCMAHSRPSPCTPTAALPA